MTHFCVGTQLYTLIGSLLAPLLSRKLTDLFYLYHRVLAKSTRNKSTCRIEQYLDRVGCCPSILDEPSLMTTLLPSLCHHSHKGSSANPCRRNVEQDLLQESISNATRDTDKNASRPACSGFCTVATRERSPVVQGQRIHA